MNDFPMFALKPYAECVGNQGFLAQEMGQCKLLFKARSVENVEIVRYHQHQDETVREGSKNVQFLGMRRSDDILFYCADMNSMTVAVSRGNACVQAVGLLLKFDRLGANFWHVSFCFAITTSRGSSKYCCSILCLLSTTCRSCYTISLACQPHR